MCLAHHTGKAHSVLTDKHYFGRLDDLNKCWEETYMVNVIHTISDNQSAYHMTFPTFGNVVKKRRIIGDQGASQIQPEKAFHTIAL